MKLSKVMEEKLNNQMIMEYTASNAYLQMGAWAEKNNLSGCSGFLFKHAEEERFHGRKIFDYMLERESLPKIKCVEEPKYEYKDIKEVFEDVYESERKVTKAIHEIVHQAWDEKDLATFSFLQWFVDEQREEESLTSAIIGKVNIIGMEGNGLYLVDQFVGSKSSK